MPTDRYDMKHFFRVLKAREERGLPKAEHSIEIPHHLTGKRVFDRTTGRTYVVQRVHKIWHWGWYTCLLLNCNGSHGMRFWDNYSSGEAYIQECCEESHRDLEILDA